MGTHTKLSIDSFFGNNKLKSKTNQKTKIHVTRYLSFVSKTLYYNKQKQQSLSILFISLSFRRAFVIQTKSKSKIEKRKRKNKNFGTYIDNAAKESGVRCRHADARL